MSAKRSAPAAAPWHGSDCAAAAQAYLARGWTVLPMEAHGKRPLVAWQELQARRPTVAEVTRWFEQHRGANVGIVTGALSGLVVLDVDPRHGGEASLAALAREHGALPATLTAVTGGGGRHHYFAHPGHRVRNRVGLAPGIDVRGDGGCVVAPPSLHASGRRYRWRAGRAPGAIAPAPLPHWLDARAVAARAGRSLEAWRELLRTGVAQGARNDTIASLAGHLFWHGVDAQIAAELLVAWNRCRCVPPLADEEVIRTVHSIANLHAAERE